MSRCKCCDKILSGVEMSKKLPDGTTECMCAKCRGSSFGEFNYVYDHQWTLEDVRDGIRPPYPMSE